MLFLTHQVFAISHTLLLLLQFFHIADTQYKQRGRTPQPRPRKPKSPFGTRAAHIGKVLHGVDKQTAKLAKLACKSSLFDDPAAQIGELSGAVRNELASVASGLEALGALRHQGRQLPAHTDAVTAWLRSRITALTDDFQSALKQREATISAKENRAAKLSGVSSLASPFGADGSTAAAGASATSTPVRAPAPAASTPFDQFGAPSGGRMVQRSQLLQRRRPTGGGAGGGSATPGQQPASHDPPAHAHASPPPAAHRGVMGGGRLHHDLGSCGFGSSPDGGYSTPSSQQQPWHDDYGGLSTPDALGGGQQQQFWTPRSQKHREAEVSQMQSTLAEIGEMFQKFGTAVASQGELIGRIDNNVEESLGHIGEAHEQILKYRNSMIGDRGMMLKVFGVLFFFVIVYGTLYR